MTLAWGATTLAAATALMLLVLAVRAPVRRWFGARIAYALWALPAARMVLPSLPVPFVSTLPLPGPVTARLSILAVGPQGVADWSDSALVAAAGQVLLALWAAGALALFATYTIRHLAFCRHLGRRGTDLAGAGDIRIMTADVDGPLAVGVFRRRIVVPRDFSRRYSAPERALAILHERAHHARGDLVANWAALAMLAVHWWNPVAWIAMRAFHEDQECAADAFVLARTDPALLPLYANLLVKAAGASAPPACGLNTRSNLKGRLIMLGKKPRSMRRAIVGGVSLFFLGGAALAASAAWPGQPADAGSRQAVTIGVKPDGAGAYALIVGDAIVAPGAPLPNGMTLPADFSGAGGCGLDAAAKPYAMAIKGSGGIQTYTVMCASPAPAPLRTTLSEGLASLQTMRASVAAQHTANFPEAERAHALHAIDRSIHEVETTLAAIG